jgi:hypothetical protein
MSTTPNPTNEILAIIPEAVSLVEDERSRKQRELNEFIAQRTQEAQGRLISILERGIVGDRCLVPLPPHLYGEWIADDASEIARMEALGFVPDTVYATGSALHSDGTGRAKVGDVIHMITSRENKELIEKLKNQVIQKRHGKAGAKVQREEEDFKNRVQKELPSQYVGANSASVAHPADARSIKDAVTQ